MMDDDTFDSDYDYPAMFTGPCTCDHEPDRHGWLECGVELPDGSHCPCEAHWEE